MNGNKIMRLFELKKLDFVWKTNASFAPDLKTERDVLQAEMSLFITAAVARSAVRL
jgi:hypothetical protein